MGNNGKDSKSDTTGDINQSLNETVMIQVFKGCMKLNNKRRMEYSLRQNIQAKNKNGNTQ